MLAALTRELNAIHWHKNPIRHLKGQGFYQACVNVLSSNVNMEICKILAQNCQVCKLATERYRQKKKIISKPNDDKNYVIRYHIFSLDGILSCQDDTVY